MGRQVRRVVLMVVAVVLVGTGCTGGERGVEPATAGSTATADPGPSSAPVAPSAPAEPAVPTRQQWRDGVEFTDVPVDGSLRTDQSLWTAIGAVSASPGRPAVVGAIRQRIDQPRTLAIWADTPQGWQDTPIPVDGSVARASLAGSAGVLAVVGTWWADGVARPFLLTSADGGSWANAALPSALDRFDLVAVSVDADRVVALAVDVHDRAVLLRTAPGGPVEVTDLPDPPAGDRHRLTGVMVSGNTVIVSGYQGPEAAGSRRPPVVHVSSDGGRTVSAAQLITGDVRAQVTGIVPVAGGFVATGVAAESVSGEADLRPAAWFSADGGAWRQEKLPTSGSLPDDGDAGLGTPVATGTEVTATVWAQASLGSSVLVRRPEGRWMVRGEIDGIGGNNVSGQVVRADAGSGNAGVDRLAAAVDGPLGLVLGHVDLAVWTPELRPALTEDLFSVSDVLASDVPRVRLSRWTRQTEGDLWSIGTEDAAAVADPAAGVLPAAFDPPEAAGKGGLTAASDPVSGAEQIGTSTMDIVDGMMVAGWYRPGPGGTWTPWLGFGAEEYESVDRIRRVGATWFAVGQRSVSAGVTDPRQGMVWSSADGVTWARVDGDFATADLPSWVADVCIDPAGTPLAVGQRGQPGGDFAPTVWSPGPDGRWVATDLPVPEGGSGVADGCGEEDAALVVTGTVGNTPARWSLAPDGTWSSLPPVGADGQPYDEKTADEIRRDDAVDIPGGQAATGFLSTTEHVGPVLWLSRDGEAWDWVPLPVAASEIRQVVLPTDGGAVVVTSTAVGVSGWRLDDTADLLAAMPPA